MQSGIGGTASNLAFGQKELMMALMAAWTQHVVNDAIKLSLHAGSFDVTSERLRQSMSYHVLSPNGIARDMKALMVEAMETGTIDKIEEKPIALEAVQEYLSRMRMTGEAREGVGGDDPNASATLSESTVARTDSESIIARVLAAGDESMVQQLEDEEGEDRDRDASDSSTSEDDEESEDDGESEDDEEIVCSCNFCTEAVEMRASVAQWTPADAVETMMQRALLSAFNKSALDE